MPEVQITDLEASCILSFPGKNSHLDKLSTNVQTSGMRISKRKKTEVHSCVKKVVFQSNPQAGGEIKDLQNLYKRQPLGTERTCEYQAQKAEKKKMSKTMKIKIYLPGGKQMFIHQNPEAELQIMDLCCYSC